ncbi:hypothetical protein RND71_042501 [Anisodus tanguticus]|uniref:Uncharacterized protein n=1 Tax=Anisodus tanguticus TaxID=243964 RepID=A0AAE1QRL5_9SOLA|nr:hypothetical protein RND71_042501 [Anisodus tanguticus]
MQKMEVGRLMFRILKMQRNPWTVQLKMMSKLQLKKKLSIPACKDNKDIVKREDLRSVFQKFLRDAEREYWSMFRNNQQDKRRDFKGNRGSIYMVVAAVVPEAFLNLVLTQRET